MYVWWYKLVSDLPYLLDDALFFGADLVITNLEVDLVALRSEAVHDRVVGCNVILVLIGIKGGDKYCVGVIMVSGQDVLITAVRSDGEAPSVVFV